MSDTGLKRRLIAILAADAAGYSRLMAADEQATVASLDAARAVFRERTQANGGRIVDTAGDSVLAVFETATGAVTASIEIQGALADSQRGVPQDRCLRFRIGVHLGDVIEKPDGTVYGDGVNIAARLQALADPGAMVVSDAVRGSVGSRVAARYEDLGAQSVKNIPQPVHAFRVVADAGAGAAGDSTAERLDQEIRFCTARDGVQLAWASIGAGTPLVRSGQWMTLVRLGWGQDNPAFRQIFTSTFIPDSSREQVDWFNELQRLATSPEQAARYLEVVADVDVTSLLGQVRAPTLVIHSRDDARVPFELGRRMAAGIPGARFVPLQSRNHIPLAHEPAFERLVEEVLAFLRA